MSREPDVAARSAVRGARSQSVTRGPRSPAHASLLRVRSLLRKELRQIFRDPKTKRIVFASPIIQLLLFGYAMNTDVRMVATYVVDHDNTFESRALIAALTAPGYFRVVGRSDRAGELQAALDRGRAVIGLQIPEHFERDLAAGRGAQVQVLVDGTNSNTGTVAQGYVNRIVQEFGLNYAEAHGQTIEGGIDLRTRSWYNPNLESRTYNVPAVIGVLLMLMSLLLTALAVVRERELGTLEQLMVSPLTPTELILGKTIPVALIAFIDLLIICTMAIAWFHIPLRGSVPTLLLGAFVYILASLGLGLFISTISHTQQEAFMSMFLLFLPAVVLSGFMYPVHTMPQVFQWLTVINPVRQFLEIVRGIFLKGDGLFDLWRQLLILTVMAVVILFAATRRFRRTIV